uniref:Carboxylic ester hydrolase-like n=1 Tax=Oryza brachyantha TaxID=4533 RepID=A0A1V1H180_ORYBR|nr:carboxylic ester hydrolase -like [Oryza brachyantha]
MVVGRAVVAAWPAPAPPAAVTVCFGANDASLPGRASALQHVPLQEYKRNLRAICDALLAAWPSVVVVLITPPPVHDRARARYPYGDDDGGGSGLPERTNESAGAYARACVEVAAERRLRAIDIWSKMQRFPGWESSFLRVVFEEVVFALKDARLGLDALPADLPLFCDMDPNDPVKSFDE